MSAAGRVCTGFSLPYVAVYSNSGTTVTYSDGQQLARGVEVSIEIEGSEDNYFYADNQAAESGAGVFGGGTLTLTVDGLNSTAAQLLYGLPDAGDDGFTEYGDDMAIPNVGVGFIVRYQSDGDVVYVPTVLAKCRFSQPGTEAATQEDEIDWQTSELTASIMRDDSSNHVWKFEGSEYATEALALAALQTKLNISASA